MALTGSKNEQKIWNYLMSKIANAYGVAGIMGNLYCESGLEPKNMQNSYEKKLGFTDDSYTAAVDNGTYKNFAHDGCGYGIAQFTYWSLKQALLEKATSEKKSIGDLELQLDFLCEQLRDNHYSVWSACRSATTVATASNAMLLKFEKPADQSTSVQNKRMACGQKYYNKYAGRDTVADTENSVPYKIKVIANVLNIRKGAGTNYAKTDVIRNRGIYTIVEEKDGPGATKWGKLKSGAGWISLDYCTKV